MANDKNIIFMVGLTR